MVAILGFVGAAASDCHLRCILCCVAPIVGRTYAVCLAVQIQRLSARDAGAAMVCCRGTQGSMIGERRTVVVLPS